MTTFPLSVDLSPVHAGVQADAARRTISGLVSPWDTYAHVSTGQVVAFAPGSLVMGDRVKLVLDHDPTQPVGVLAGSQATPAGQTASFRVPGGPRGDEALADAAEGLRDGLSVGAEIDAADETDQGLYVTRARVRHVALLSEPAYDTARVTAVAAASPERTTVTVTENTQTTDRAPAATVEGTPVGPAQVAAGGTGPATAAPAAPPATAATGMEAGGGVTLTAAGRVASTPLVHVGLEPYPYAIPQDRGGPSFVLDCAAAFGIPTPGGDAGRWHRAEAMAADPRVVAAGLLTFAAPPPGILAAGEGTTTSDPALVPSRVLPDRYVPILSPKAPLYSSLTKYGTPDFNTLLVPRTASEAGLSGKPADELTPIAPGTIGTATDTVTIEEVEGSYRFSRKLLMGSNPQIDRIALNAMDRAWTADVETRATAYFTAAGHYTAFNSTYADGLGFSRAVRAAVAGLAANTVHTATVAIPAGKEYIAAANADDTADRPLFPAGPQVNAPGTAGDAYRSISIQGLPLLPGPYMTANHTLILDQDTDSAVAWVTPVMNFRLEWTGDGNTKVLQLTKYSGVGFWAQYVGGVVLITNSTPLPLDAGGFEATEAEPAAAGHGKAK